MTERDENGLTRGMWWVCDEFNAATTDEALENQQRNLARQGIYKSVDDLINEHALVLIEKLEKERQ